MAPKRSSEDFNHSDPNKSTHKQIKTTHKLAYAVGEAIMNTLVGNLGSAIEPIIRKVVTEEVEKAIERKFPSISRSPSLRIKAPEPQSFRLTFMTEKLSLPIFTNNKITDINKNPLQILLIDEKGCPGSMFPTTMKVEIVVLNGDFPSSCGVEDSWSCEEFDTNVLKERKGKRPLLAGGFNVVMRNGAVLIGNLVLTDNSRWISSGKFRLGARVIQSSCSQVGVRIRPAITESFIVKDRRGETNQKHYPPALQDELWRLKRIGKDGVFHKKLCEAGINNVQELLKLNSIDSNNLKKVLREIGMSEKMMDVSLKHALTCEMGNKLYVSQGPNHTIILNPVCQVVKVVINGQVYANSDFTPMHKANIDNVVQDAYANWNNLEEVDAQVYEATPSIGYLMDQTSNQQLRITTRAYAGQSISNKKSKELTSEIISKNNEQFECSDWFLYFSETSPSNGDFIK